MSDDAVRKYALSIGADLDKHPELAPLVLEGFNEPLPEGWVVTKPEDDEDDDAALYFNERTGSCIAEHPHDRIYRMRVATKLQQLEAAGDSRLKYAGGAVTSSGGGPYIDDDVFDAAFGADADVAAPAGSAPLFDVVVPHDDDLSDDGDGAADATGAHATPAAARVSPHHMHPGDQPKQPAPVPPPESSPRTDATHDTRGVQLVPRDVEPIDEPGEAGATGPGRDSSPSHRPATESADRAVPETTKKKNAIPIPVEFICPITSDVMKDPVVAMDGFSYERSAIEEWLASHNTSPCTNDVLPSLTLVPNIALRNFVRDFLSKHEGELEH